MPLVDAGLPVGVLQVLDKRFSGAFSLQEMDLLAVFARQAAAAIQAARAGRDSVHLLRTAIAGVAGGALDEPALDRLVREAASELDDDAAAPYWRLVDQVARTHASSRADLGLVGQILKVAARHHGRSGGM